MSDPAAGRSRPRPARRPPEVSPPLLPRAGDEFSPEVPTEAPPRPADTAPPASYVSAPPAVAAAPVQPSFRPVPPAVGAVYVSTVRAPAQIVLGLVVAAGIAWVLTLLGLWPLAVVGVALVLVGTFYLSTVTTTVTPAEITLAQGRGERDPRSIATSELTEVSAAAFTWPQCFGLDRLRQAGDTRLAVRAGPTLRLTLRSNEHVLVSVQDTAAAINLLPESVRRT